MNLSEEGVIKMWDSYVNYVERFTNGASGVVLLVFYIALAVGMFRLFERKGKAGILAFIPIVNIFVMSDIAFGSALWGLLTFVPVVNLFFVFLLNYKFVMAYTDNIGLGLLAIFFNPFVCIYLAFATK